jgi:hypothetical protein
MNNLSLSERRLILNLVGALLWCSFRPNRKILRETARALDLDGDGVLFELLDLPPRPEDIDPNKFTPRAHRLAQKLCEPLAAQARSHAAFEFLSLLERVGPDHTSKSRPSQGIPYDALSEAA